MSERPTSRGSAYPLPWIATYLVTGLFLVAVSIGIAWFLDRPSSKFDYDDPDMQLLERIVLSAIPRNGDFSVLNGGDWQALCLVGFGGDVRAAAEAAPIEKNAAQAVASTAETVREQVAETEFALVYVDGAGVAKAVRHPHGFAFATANAALCTSRDQPVLALPVLPK